MQNTRLNLLLASFSNQAQQFFANPWRRISLLLISLLFGFFMALAISSIAGQRGDLDVVVAAIMLIFTEVVSRVAYRNNRNNSGLIDFLNLFKVGLTYGFYLQAFILGS
ncbi:DUF565 domain-containing protein [Euhalothece natronophila Z-M001]|uniref:DUF565 domain-containing protein n=1 Tax=Euhalothece natronophila Z-M001 TaxID=522448 RepID=A0A5B8NHW1_9CHRO|nr:DUF565 domain-containing protein [Euhalothece natronophila]QDZ38773.1 DUF565 domain-containing protein [Euhalothece natronophila Z-M001]